MGFEKKLAPLVIAGTVLTGLIYKADPNEKTHIEEPRMLVKAPPIAAVWTYAQSSSNYS